MSVPLSRQGTGLSAGPEAARTVNAYVKSLESKLEASIAATQSPGVPSQLPRRTSTPECAPYDTEVMDASASPAALNGTVDENLGSSQNEIDFDHAFPLPSPRPDVQLEARDSGLTGQVTDSSHPPIFTDPTLSSSVNFGCEVKAMPRTSWPSTNSANNQIAKSPDNAYGLQFESPRSSGVPESILWPSESDAEDLLSTVMSSVGKLQHLFDPRTFADRFSRDYGRIVDGTYSVDAWYVELLLVLAVGALLKGRKSGTDILPGAQLFTEATMRCPGLIQLRAAGTLGVEINGLSAFFLQCADRKDDAYIYAGTALRLSVSMGLFRESRSGTLPRRLAAATGNPSLMSDEMVRIPRPMESPGFSSAVILNVNISIATITGRIINTVYSHKKQSEEKFVSEVREILQSLGHARQGMPLDCVMDFSSPFPLTRDCITLNLMLYQAIILTTRPALLHLAKARITNQGIPTRNDVFEKFSRTCIDAAERSLSVLCAAKEQNLIAPFGFFDLDALFSVAFVLILAGSAFCDAQKMGVVHGLKRAMSLFDYLAERGNRASLCRKSDIEQMCNHVGVSLGRAGTPSGDLQNTPTPTHHPAITPRYDPAAEIIRSPQQPDQSGNQSGYLHPLRDPGPPPLWQTENSLYDSFSGSVPRDLYTIYQNNDLALSGSIELDWEELERQLLLHQ
ncbi:Proline utilization trans-activator [Penicillium chrysogenum]|uniref:Proline utilization trans-activator n=1 Tax=Penicillium chrysogenum TaxID=5076 RepID=A0A162CPL2_PENCH|nr:Proline utilization trans-activator [Penicillium chrysogenum]